MGKRNRDVLVFKKRYYPKAQKKRRINPNTGTPSESQLQPQRQPESRTTSLDSEGAVSPAVVPSQLITTGPFEPRSHKWFRATWERRRNFSPFQKSNIVLLVMVAAGLFLTGVTAYFVDTIRGRIHQAYACRSPVCRELEERAQMFAGKTDPCDDFFAYVCHKWINGSNAAEGFIEEHNVRAKAELKQRFFSHKFYGTSETLLQESMIMFFQSCYTFRSSTNVGDSMRIMSRRFFSWIFHTTKLWLHGGLSLEDLYPKMTLFSLRMNYTTVLRVSLSASTCTIAPGMSFRSKTSLMSEKERYLLLEKLIWSVQREISTQPFVEAVLQIDSAIHKLEAVQSQTVENFPRVRDLNLLNYSGWVEAFTADLLEGYGGGGTQVDVDKIDVSVVNRGTIESMMAVLESAPAVIRTLYVAVVAVYPHFDMLFGSSRFMSPTMFCTMLTSQLFTTAYIDFVVKNQEPKVRGDIITLFEGAKAAFLRYIKNISEDAVPCARRFSLRTFTRRLRPQSFSKGLVSEDFLANVFRLHIWQVAQEANLSAITRSKSREPFWARLEWEGHLGFVPASHAFVIATQNMIPEVFIEERLYMNVGLMGVAMQQGILSACFPSVMLDNPKGKIRDELSCYSSQHGTLTANASAGASRDIFKRVTALRLAYNQSRDAPLAEDERLAADQLFFLRSCLMHCHRDWDPDGEEGVLPPRLRCHIPLMNTPEFHQAYGCREGSPMRAVKPCPKA
ncbi:uncharacterized protein LOC135399953 [Ornithodoros turicata]|uniref:uncharacterized protein LOC135399953 n=1 Tax=Ornithodoros turicata TaxID=34597 RepID=UPI003139FB80